MTNPDFRPFDIEDKFARLVEELGEVLKEIGKVQRFGLETRWDGRKPSEWPCHQLPKERWCDHSGQGGFMGHTCERPKAVESNREALLREMRDLREIVGEIEKELLDGCRIKPS